MMATGRGWRERGAGSFYLMDTEFLFGKMKNFQGWMAKGKLRIGDGRQGGYSDDVQYETKFT